MKKNNEKGFSLVETLVTATFIMGTLVFLFVQFRSISQNYQTSFKYNSVQGLYALESMRMFYLQDNFSGIANNYRSGSMKYLDLSTCPSSYIRETSYCMDLVNSLKIKTILMTDADMSYLLAVLNGVEDIEPGMKRFIRTIKNDEAGTLLKYRLIVEMEDGTYANIKVSER